MVIDQTLDSLYGLYRITVELSHGVKRENTAWALFEPSRFVYSYFTFNSVYSFDWAITFEQDTPTEWPPNQDGPRKIKSLLDFCYSELQDRVAPYVRPRLEHNLSGVDNPAQALMGIVPDRRITEDQAKAFRGHFNRLMDSELLDSRQHQAALTEALRFVHRVRNNVFHGSKGVVQMADESQQKRFIIYTALLVSTIELFLVAAESKGWKKREEPLDYWTPRRPSVGAIRARIERPGSKHVKPLSLPVPEGAFFYPCCGTDTIEPIQQFIDRIKEFHFVDSDIQIPLPVPACGVGCMNPRGEMRPAQRGPRRRDIENTPYTTDVVTRTYDYASRPSLVRLEVGSQQADLGHLRIPICIGQQAWEMADGSERTFFRYRSDAYLILREKLREIAVFYQRRNSDEGSSLYWFGPTLFHLILDKLVDKGLIVTDGSMFHRQHLDVPWSPLKSPEETGSDPPLFNYNGREFVCLGQVGQGHGPVYAWQVNRTS